MATPFVFVQRCMVILTLVLCFFHVSGNDDKTEKFNEINCEQQPFHSKCRGLMLRKRTLFPIIYGPDCEGDKGRLNCIRALENWQRVSFVPWSKSKLFLSLLDNDLPMDVNYAAGHRQRNNAMEERGPPLMDSFLSQLDSSDDY